MKELSVEEKAKAYDEAIERAKKHCADYVVETIFPELKESEDEKIRKELIEFVDTNTLSVDERHNRWLAWLEKQGEQKLVECRQETKPNGGIVYEDFNDGDGYYKANLAYLNKSQVELIENLVASWQNPVNNTAEWSEEDERHLNSIIKRTIAYGDSSIHGLINDDIDWLKSLRPQNKWKPSDLQIEALNAINVTGGVSYAGQGQELINLYNDLKKLKEE